MEDGGTVHRLDTPCEDGIRGILGALQKGASAALWGTAEAVRIDLERNVPWCSGCCLEEASGGV
jgi:hypothetical protein